MKTLCIICSESVEDSTAVGKIGHISGPLCASCAFWCDGNVLPTHPDQKRLT